LQKFQAIHVTFLTMATDDVRPCDTDYLEVYDGQELVRIQYIATSF